MGKSALLAVAVLGMFAWGCPNAEPPPAMHEHSEYSERLAMSNAVHLPESVQQFLEIKLEQAKQRKCPTLLEAMGKVLAPRARTAIVSHAFPARVVEIHVEVGDWVQKGRELVVLESKDVGEAKAEFYTAAARCELAKVNFARGERLLKEGIGAKKNFVEAEAEYKVAQANLEAAEKKLHVLGFTEEQVKEIASTHQINPAIALHAPIEGKVVEIKVVRGAMVDAATPILTIIDPRCLWVDAEIYEKDIAKIRVGQRVEVRVPALSGQTFQGQVSYIGDVVNPDTRTITVRTEVANDGQLLKPGMFADVEIVLDEGQQVLVVPSAAVLEEGGQKIVFVRQQGNFVRRQIATGAVYRNCHQVLSGLKPGEEVVVQGNHELKSKLYEEVLKAGHVH